MHAKGGPLLVLALLTACSSATSGSPTSPPSSASATPLAAHTAVPSPTPDLSSPVGIIAMGHSGLTGEGTGALYQVVLENSWATGTSEAVNSIYLRMIAALPETQGHVANTATGGAAASLLLDQTTQALRIVPVPELAIISTLDNDIRCDGTDAEHVAQFGEFLLRALQLISTTSPNTKIIVIGQLGRPSPAFIEEQVADDPSVKGSLTGAGICDFYDPAGNLVEQNFVTLTGIIDAYEAEQARVCALVSNCQTDGGVRAAWIDQIEYFRIEAGHLTVAGQAAEAENLWPVVSRVLGL